ncbi:MAG: circadian clock KaiB family protein [Leptolyngbyaceae cyanobacterium]
MSQQPYILKLYITGSSPRSERAIANLVHLCEQELADNYELSIIDVLEQPQLAEREKILVTPTLIKEVPPPSQRIIGDLSDATVLSQGLDIQRSSKSNPVRSSVNTRE